MALILVSSSSLRAVGENGSTLAVIFRTSDTIYTHPRVPYSVYLGLMRAESMGAYFNQQLNEWNQWWGRVRSLTQDTLFRPAEPVPAAR